MDMYCNMAKRPRDNTSIDAQMYAVHHCRSLGLDPRSTPKEWKECMMRMLGRQCRVPRQRRGQKKTRRKK